MNEIDEAPTEPSKDPAEHESPQAYAEAWWRFHRDTYKWAWEAMARHGTKIADGTEYPQTISDFSSLLHTIEYHGAMAQHFVNVHSMNENPQRETDGWAVYSISMGRELFDTRSHRSSNEVRNWAEGVKREATLDFIKQCRPLLDTDYLLGKV